MFCEWYYRIEVLRPGAEDWAFVGAFTRADDADREHFRRHKIEAPGTIVRTMTYRYPFDPISEGWRSTVGVDDQEADGC